MKKLMITAAAAAMIGGAYADFVYDFTAKVTTTVAKQGSSVTATAKIGNDAPGGTGNWWYNDPVFTPNANPKYLDWNGYEKVAVQDATGVFKLQIGKIKTEDRALLAADLAAYSFPEIYKGKERWCATWTYKLPGTCIRAKGSETIKSWYAVANCCAATVTPAAPLVLDEVDADGFATAFLGDMYILTLYRFGGVKSDLCKSVEVVGHIGDEGISQVGPYTTIPQFAIAGQGAWGVCKDSNKNTDVGISTVSGNIVGIWYEAECEVCCGADRSSLAYSCDTNLALVKHNITGFVDIDNIVGDDTAMGLVDYVAGADQWGTAAFGTFTLKFNPKMSDL